MDNAKFHLTKDVKKIFQESQIKVMTISPYNSDQNMIELVFRYIKNIIKKYNFKTILKMKKKIIEILEKEETKKIILKLYRSTLLYYRKFLEKNNETDKLEDDFKILIGT